MNREVPDQTVNVPAVLGLGCYHMTIKTLSSMALPTGDREIDGLPVASLVQPLVYINWFMLDGFTLYNNFRHCN